MTTTAPPPGRKKTRRPGEWTEAEEALLTDLWNEGALVSHIAEVVGRPTKAARNKARRMLLPKRESYQDTACYEAMRDMADPVKRSLRLLSIARHCCRIQQGLWIDQQGGAF